MRRLTSRPIAAASPEGRSGVISLTSLRNRCKLGAPRSAGRDRSQCSSRARVVRLGMAPFKKFLSALGLSPISRAARRKERLASSRSTAARSAGMGRTKDAAPGRRGAALTGAPKAAQFVQLASPYTGNPTIRTATRQVGPTAPRSKRLGGRGAVRCRSLRGGHSVGAPHGRRAGPLRERGSQVPAAQRDAAPTADSHRWLSTFVAFHSTILVLTVGRFLGTAGVLVGSPSGTFAHPPGTGRPKRRRCWRIASFWCVNSRTLVRGYALQSNTKPAARSSG